MSRVEELLKEYRDAVGNARLTNAKSGRPADGAEVLDLLEQMIRDCLTGLLEELCERAHREEDTHDLIRNASAALETHAERFAKGAPLGYLAQQVEGLNQVLRDIGYMREGFGSGSDRPDPPDMKWRRASSVESYVRGTMREVASELKSEGADVTPLTAEVDLDLAATHQGIVKLLKRDLPVSKFVDAAIDLGQRQTDVAGWDAFRALPYGDELEKRSSFFVDVITQEPPKVPVAGFYAEVAYPSRLGKTVADLDLTGSDGYQPDDEDWFGEISYWPKNAYLGSEVLAKIYELAYAPGGLGNAADYTLCLAWAAYFSRVCARRYLAEIGSDFVGLRVGFSGGDWIELGWVRPS